MDEFDAEPAKEPVNHGLLLLRMAIGAIPMLYFLQSGPKAVGVIVAIVLGVGYVSVTIHWVLWKTGRVG
ncbi:hypothetical protein [Ornithinimicrobium sp. INDO-MA30-4]|uniref:hypothetical protein n=1 Tax=Ornithinimicrobium sp. INDO-MA30-4 TaxID=2908651 RepID=UPI001F45F5DC|nr:hypothetical protein [Ornithinimicrobium sp. INDO-MA30-4]UJH70183.1 hypothetical protein L0A91_13515 [Ornithinimicrobium sp. INDO-MA30-4]